MKKQDTEMGHSASYLDFGGAAGEEPETLKASWWGTSYCLPKVSERLSLVYMMNRKEDVHHAVTSSCSIPEWDSLRWC